MTLIVVICGEKHMMKDFTNKNKPKYINCCKYNEEYDAKRNCKHTSTDFKKCETYKKIVEKIKNKTDYIL